MDHNTIPRKHDAICLRTVNEFIIERPSPQGGIYLHEMHDRSCGAACKARDVDITVEIGAQWDLICIRVIAGPLIAQQNVISVMCIEGDHELRQLTLTLSVILLDMSGAMSCIKYALLCDRRSLFKASCTEMPEWFSPFRRNLTVIRPPGR